MRHLDFSRMALNSDMFEIKEYLRDLDRYKKSEPRRKSQDLKGYCAFLSTKLLKIGMIINIG